MTVRSLPAPIRLAALVAGLGALCWGAGGAEAQVLPGTASAAPAAESAETPVDEALTSEAALARLLAVLQDDAARAALVTALEAQAASDAEDGDAADAAAEPEPALVAIAPRLVTAASALAQDVSDGVVRLGRGLKTLADLRARLPEIGPVERQVVAALIATILSTVAATLVLEALALRLTARLRPRAGARASRLAWRAILALLCHLVALALAWAAGWAVVLLAFSEDGQPWTSQVLYLLGFLAFGFARLVLRAAANPDAGQEPALSPQPPAVQRAAYRAMRPVAAVVTLGFVFGVPLVRYWAGDAAAASARPLMATAAALAALWAIRGVRRATRDAPILPLRDEPPREVPPADAPAAPSITVSDGSVAGDPGPVAAAPARDPEAPPAPALGGVPEPDLAAPADAATDPAADPRVAAPVPPPSQAPAAVAEGLGLAWRALWPPLAVGYVLYAWFAVVARSGEGTGLAFHGSVASGIAIALVLAGLALLRRAHRAGLPVPARLSATVPTLKPRADRILAALAVTVAALMLLAAPVVVAAGWRWIDAGRLAANPTLQGLSARAVSAALVLLGAALLWAVVASWIDARLARSTAGHEAARARTLLALFRNAFTIAVVVLGGMVALSQVGLDIAPLLAGAGVVGLAIGFGAQTLVKDIITGIFIQIEGAIDVGDVVGVAGITGGVERLTIRSVRLRTMDGATHVIPFSAVTTVTNLTRDFGYHVAELAVGYGESLPAVRAAMQEAFDRLMREPLAAEVDGPLDMQGVAEMRGDSLLVRARIRTRPGQQWAVGRRYSEILKEVLDARRIVVPVASRTIFIPEGGPAGATPLPEAGAA